MVTVTSLQYGTFIVVPGRPGFPGIKKSIPEFPGMEIPSGNNNPTHCHTAVKFSSLMAA